jgi:glycosyltransferase involved in cell wall biosynthesis
MEAGGARLHLLDGSHGRLGWLERSVRLVRSLQPDLVHTTLFEADIAGRLAGALTRTPVVSSLVNDTYGSGFGTNIPKVRLRAAQLLDAASARAVRRFHAVTGAIADNMARRLLIARMKIDVIGRGRDPIVLGRRTSERRKQARVMLGVGDDETLLLCAARHEYQKGLDVLIAAMPDVLKAVPSARVLVAGREGAATPELHELIERLRLHDVVRLGGHRPDVADILCAADVFILPSRWEGLPGAVIEALALEAPIVSSDLTGVRDIVEKDLGSLVPPEDPVALATAIVDSVRDSEATTERARRGRIRFEEHFTIEAVSSRMVEFYERALEGSR